MMTGRDIRVFTWWLVVSFAIGLMILGVLLGGTAGSIRGPTRSPPAPIHTAYSTTNLPIMLTVTPAIVETHASRGPQIQLSEPPPRPVVTGLHDLPYAPEGLTGCDEMEFYRIQAGLPDRFKALGFRESNCRNEVGVHTFCCYGYWQLYFKIHMADHQLGPLYAVCEVDAVDDYNGDEPLDKQKQACVTMALYTLKGYTPWQR